MAIQIRYGVNSGWEADKGNIVSGEPAVATDTNRVFIGVDTGKYMELANILSIAPSYDSASSYSVGDYVSRGGKLYICNTNTTGAWDSSCWSETTIGSELTKTAYSLYQTETASGNVVSFDNGASNIPVRNLAISIKAQQNLNGYEYAWIGGAGKNKFNINDLTRNKYLKSDGSTGSNSAWGISGYIAVTAGTTYTFNPNSTGGATAKHCFYDSSKNFVSSIDSGGQTFTVDSGIAYVRFSLRTSGTQASSDVQLEVGSTATAYEPYSNICPITGYSNASVYVSPTTIASDGRTYTVSFDSAGDVYGGTLNVTTGVLTVTHKFITITSGFTNGGANYSKYKLGVLGYLDTTETAYCNILKRHTGSTSSISAGSFLILNSSANNGAYVYVRFVTDTTISTATARTTFTNNKLAELNNEGTPMQLVFGLSTPITAQLTAQQVRTLLNKNNIWTDVGDIVEITYCVN